MTSDCLPPQVPLVAVLPEFDGQGIDHALQSYVDLVARKAPFGASAKVLRWLDGRTDGRTDVSRVQHPAHELVAPDSIGGVRPPRHLGTHAALRLHACGHQARTEYSSLCHGVAAVALALVEADKNATEETKIAARRLVASAPPPEADVALELDFTDQNQLRLPEHTAGGLKGRLVALWIEEDAQFMLKRFDEFHEQLTEPVVKAPTAAGCRTDRGHQPTEVLVSLTAWAVAEDGDGYVLDDKTDVLYAHQLHACPTVAWGSDREACVRTGLAIDLNGDALRVCRPWHDVSVQVG